MCITKSKPSKCNVLPKFFFLAFPVVFVCVGYAKKLLANCQSNFFHDFDLQCKRNCQKYAFFSSVEVKKKV